MKPINLALETDPKKVVALLERYTTPAFEMRYGQFRGLSVVVRSAIEVINRQRAEIERLTK